MYKVDAEIIIMCIRSSTSQKSICSENDLLPIIVNGFSNDKKGMDNKIISIAIGDNQRHTSLRSFILRKLVFGAK